MSLRRHRRRRHLVLGLLKILALSLSPGGCRSEAPAKDGHGHAGKPGGGGAHGHEEGQRGSHDGPGQGHGQHAAIKRRFRLPPQVIKDARIRTARVGRGTLASTLALPGEVAAHPDRSARVASPVAGRIEKVHVAEGARVKAGEVLAVVRIPELGTMRGDYQAARARARAARTNAEQLRALAKDGLAARQAVLDAEAQAHALETQARALGGQLASMGAGGKGGGASLLPVRSPIAGVVVARKAVVGQPVGKEEVIATVADLDEVWFLGRVFEKDLGRLRQGARAEVELNAYPDRRFAGTVTYIGQKVDPVARTITARIPLANKEGLLRLGLFGVARVATDESASGQKRQLLVVPQSALTEIGGKPVVFVRHPDGELGLHDVVRGGSALGQVEILSGLKEGEEVVVEGVFTLKSVVLRSTLDEDHH